MRQLLHLGVTMSRRSSGGGDGIAVDEGQSFGLELLFSRSGVSLTAALVATFLVTYGSYKKDCKA